ncbi:hypothetical protein BC827DRAFT_1241516 [Russula dissimulans]|nr:hypothetical protein BC827DRAFT_1241516 [Russula dissimulans]
MNSSFRLTATSTLTACSVFFALQHHPILYPNKLAFLSHKMIAGTPDRPRPHQATESLPLTVTPVRERDGQDLPHVKASVKTKHSTHVARQYAPPPCPRIPRLVSRYAKYETPAVDSQFQVNASHMQRPLSLVVPVSPFYLQTSYDSADNALEGKCGKEYINVGRTAQSRVSDREVISLIHPLPIFSSLHPPNRRSSEIESSSSSERYESSGGAPGHTHPRHQRSHRRGHQASPPTDSDDDDPFHFDSILSSQPTKKEDDSPSRTLSSSLFRRASIIPVDPTATPAPHRFSLLRERGSEETIFVQEICDADGRRWSLRVPASGLPEDMVHMLEELEKLAVELGQALPRIVVTCSAESLSRKRRERDVVLNSSELLRPPPTVDDESLIGYDSGARRSSLAQEKRRLASPEHVSEEPTRLSEPPSAVVPSASEQSLKCIYLPEPAEGFHSKPTHWQATECPRQRLFFSALKEPQPASVSGIAKRLVAHSTTGKTEFGTGTGTGAASASDPTTPSAKSKSRIATAQAAKGKSALPVLKIKSRSPPRRSDDSDGLRGGPGAVAVQDVQELVPSTDHVKTDGGGGAAMPTTVLVTVTVQSDVGMGASESPSQGHYPTLTTQSPNRNGPVDSMRAVSEPTPPTGRKLRHLFRRPPVRSVSHPPLYSHSVRPVVGAGVKRPASEVVPAQQETVERRMPRLPSARNLLRRLT